MLCDNNWYLLFRLACGAGAGVEEQEAERIFEGLVRQKEGRSRREEYRVRLGGRGRMNLFSREGQQAGGWFHPYSREGQSGERFHPYSWGGQVEGRMNPYSMEGRHEDWEARGPEEHGPNQGAFQMALQQNYGDFQLMQGFGRGSNRRRFSEEKRLSTKKRVSSEKRLSTEKRVFREKRLSGEEARQDAPAQVRNCVEAKEAPPVEVKVAEDGVFQGGKGFPTAVQVTNEGRCKAAEEGVYKETKPVYDSLYIENNPPSRGAYILPIERGFSQDQPDHGEFWQPDHGEFRQSQPHHRFFRDQPNDMVFHQNQPVDIGFHQNQPVDVGFHQNQPVDIGFQAGEGGLNSNQANDTRFFYNQPPEMKYFHDQVDERGLNQNQGMKGSFSQNQVEATGFFPWV